VLPVALVLLILGIAAASSVLIWGVIGLAIVLGVYLIFWTFDVDEALIESVRSASTDIRQGSVAFGFGLFAIALVGVGFLSGYNAANLSAPPLDRVLFFLQAGLIWWLLGALVWEVGRAIRRTLARGRFPRSFVVATTSIIGIGLVSFGIVYLVRYLQGVSGPSQLPILLALLLGGFGLVIGAGALQQYLKALAARAVVEPASPGSG
jgi:uncharacterized membrane protein